MSIEYDKMLASHRANIRKAYFWIKKSLPEVLIPGYDYSWYIDFHDDTKTIPGEYEAYDNYIFGKRTKEVEQRYLRAKLEHIQANPHHWQHWILHNNDGTTTVLDMDYPYIIEMICDWWSFGWEKGDLFQIFDWYDENKKKIKFSKKTRATVEDILDKLEKAIIRVRGPRK